MKRPWVAFVLSFILPGAGLAYVGYWRLAVVNFVIVAAITVGFVIGWPRDSLFDWMHYFLLILGAASGGVAHAFATWSNDREEHPPA